MYVAFLEKCKTGDLLLIPLQVDVNTSSYIVANILNGLKMPEVFLEVPIGNSSYDRKVLETLTQAANAEKVLCNKEIIHEGVGIEESTTCGEKVDSDSPQIREVCSIRCRFAA